MKILRIFILPKEHIYIKFHYFSIILFDFSMDIKIPIFNLILFLKTIKEKRTSLWLYLSDTKFKECATDFLQQELLETRMEKQQEFLFFACSYLYSLFFFYFFPCQKASSFLFVTFFYFNRILSFFLYTISQVRQQYFSYFKCNIRVAI